MSHQKTRIGDRMVGWWRGKKRKRVKGSITTGSPNVYVNGKKCARINDRGRHSRGSFTITTGRPDVIINGRKTAYKGSRTNNRKGVGTLISGSSNVYTS